MIFIRRVRFKHGRARKLSHLETSVRSSGPYSVLKSAYECGVLLGRVDPVRGAIDLQHVYRSAVLQRTKLLEFFGLFQRRRRPACELEQKIAPVRVNSQMQIIRAVRVASRVA